jgi:hypothetical protein
MIPCLKCGGKTGVHDTRTRNFIVWRRRTCAECGERFTTYEYPKSYLKRMRRCETNMEKVHDLARWLNGALDEGEFAVMRNLIYQIMMLTGGV